MSVLLLSSSFSLVSSIFGSVTWPTSTDFLWMNLKSSLRKELVISFQWIRVTFCLSGTSHGRRRGRIGSSFSF